MYLAMDSFSRNYAEDFLNSKDIENETLIGGDSNYDAPTTLPAKFQRYCNVHNTINCLLTAVLIFSIIVAWQYNGQCSSGVENYYYYCVYSPFY